MNTTEFLSLAVAICPNKVALIFENQRYTFSQLNERINRLANGLLGIGIKRGDRVAMLQVNCHQCVEAYFASAKLGAIYVPLNFRAKGNELTYMLNNAEATTLFAGERYADLVNSIKPELPSLRNLIFINHQQPGTFHYEEMITSSPGSEITCKVNDTDITILMYTAGTTGLPKGVMLSHNSFTLYALENVSLANAELEEKTLLSAPLYHVAGTQTMLASIYGGRTLVIERQFEPKEWMELVARERVSRAMIVPTMLKQVMDHPDFGKYDLSSLKIITYGASPMPFDVIRRAVEVFPAANFINAFGQTETASTITTLSPEDHTISGTKEEKERKLKRLSSIGKPTSDVEIKVVDEGGNELLVGQVGEIVARGPRIMRGYWRDDEKTASTINEEGWVHTGDLGYVDKDGYFFLVGRATDMIIRGGENISPEEIEAVLLSHPKVEETAVIGIPDVDWGEVPMAIVVLKQGGVATAAELIEHCHTNLASFKSPKAVIFVKELPRNPMGKVLKRVLRDQYSNIQPPIK